ncbi:nuclear transport factor 2 family protein [Yersinia enterocolitica]|uniref:nuclear transport factor 2 family protein n=1 Tax=Yersinia enterocolitica TaxID=630 RepID=UPI003D78E3D5|nr:nuclear transport factor 2 family protein [Cronobacter turicensis]
MAPALFDKYISAVMEKSSDKLASLFSVDGRLSLPFRRTREVIVGRDNIRLHYANGFGIAPLRFTSIEDVRFHYTDNPHVVIVEYKLHGNTLPDEKKFSLLYVNIIKINDDEITELIDYEDVLNREYIFQD